MKKIKDMRKSLISTIFIAFMACIFLVGCGRADPDSFTLRDAERFLNELGENAFPVGEDSRPERIHFNLRGRYTLIRENREPGRVSWDFRMNDFPDLEFNVRTVYQGSFVFDFGHVLRSNYNSVAHTYVFNEFVVSQANNPAFDGTKWSQFSVYFESSEDLEIQAQFFQDFVDFVYDHELIFAFGNNRVRFHSATETEDVFRTDVPVGIGDGRFPIILRTITEEREGRNVISHYIVEDDFINHLLGSYDKWRERIATSQRTN